MGGVIDNHHASLTAQSVQHRKFLRGSPIPLSTSSNKALVNRRLPLFPFGASRTLQQIPVYKESIWYCQSRDTYWQTKFLWHPSYFPWLDLPVPYPVAHRQQCVMVHGHVSTYKSVVCGVPQGLVLGTLLFLLCINGLFHVLNFLWIILFADDTNIFPSHDYLTTLTKLIFLMLNFLMFPLGLMPKTSLSRFTIFILNVNRLVLQNNVNILINNTPITHVQEYKFLGIIIQDNLAWKPHIIIIAICDKVSKVTGILSKSRHYLPSDTLKMSYNSLFLPYINYCNLIWISRYASHLEPHHLLQKKAICVIITLSTTCTFQTSFLQA